MAETSVLVEEVFATGTLKGLPDQLSIDGAWRPAPAKMETFDPGSGRAFAEFGIAEPKDVDAAVEAAHKAQLGECRRSAAGSCTRPRSSCARTRHASRSSRRSAATSAPASAARKASKD